MNFLYSYIFSDVLDRTYFNNNMPIERMHIINCLSRERMIITLSIIRVDENNLSIKNSFSRYVLSIHLFRTMEY